MAKKRCEECGRFMKLTDLMPDEDEFDEELAIACGLTDEEIEHEHCCTPYGSRFRYVQDLWECDNCHTSLWHTEGKRYYWNSDSLNYDAEKPLTLKEQAEREQEAQEAAGQLRLLD